MILAAGRGKRLRPLTDKIPKPLVEVGGKPLIVWHIEKLKAAGIEEIIINIDYLGDMIIDAIGDGSRWSVAISYSDERESGALETLGGIVKALPFLQNSDPFLVVNADIFSDFQYSAGFRLEEGLEAHLVLVPTPSFKQKGDFGLEGTKITDEAKFTFSGIGYYRPSFFLSRLLQRAPLAPLLREKVMLGKISGELHKGLWSDVGTLSRLNQIKEMIQIV